MGKGTSLSTEIMFGLLQYTCLLGEGFQGLFSLGQCRGYLHLRVIKSKEKRKGGGGKEGKGDLRDKA